MLPRSSSMPRSDWTCAMSAGSVPLQILQKLERLIGEYRGELLAGVEGMGNEYGQWLTLERTPHRESVRDLCDRGGVAHRRPGRPRCPQQARRTPALFRRGRPRHDRAVPRRKQRGRRPRRLRRVPQPAAPRPGAHALDRDVGAVPAETEAEPSIPATPQRRKTDPGYRQSFVPRVVLLPPLQDFKQSELPRAPGAGAGRGCDHRVVAAEIGVGDRPAHRLAARSVQRTRRSARAPDRLCRRKPHLPAIFRRRAVARHPPDPRSRRARSCGPTASPSRRQRRRRTTGISPTA